MPQVLNCGFQQILGSESLFKDATVKKGTQLLEAGHLVEVSELQPDVGASSIEALCLPQYNGSIEYAIQLTVSKWILKQL